MTLKNDSKYTLPTPASDNMVAKSFAFFGAPPAETLVFFYFFWGLLEGVSGAFPYRSTIARGGNGLRRL